MTSYLPGAPASKNGNFVFNEPLSERVLWLAFEELADVPERGTSLFAGTQPERKRLYREFHNYVRQGRAYWDAARLVRGSAAALPFYYSALQLAKGELLQSNAARVTGLGLTHGLSFRTTGSSAFAGDHLLVKDGVFSLLYKKRTGLALPRDTKLPIKNLLALIPEIGHEYRVVVPKPPRPISAHCYFAVASTATEAWSLVLVPDDLMNDAGERHVRAMLSAYREVDLSGFGSVQWRELFALSQRFPHSTRVLESKRTHSTTQADGAVTPDRAAAHLELRDVCGTHFAEPVDRRSDFVLTPTIYKTTSTILPLSLVRYAAMYYLSSLVRYKPASLDPVSQAAQAWLMDSFVREVPMSLFAGLLMGILNRSVYYEAAHYRV